MPHLFMIGSSELNSESDCMIKPNRSRILLMDLRLRLRLLPLHPQNLVESRLRKSFPFLANMSHRQNLLHPQRQRFVTG